LGVKWPTAWLRSTARPKLALSSASDNSIPEVNPSAATVQITVLGQDIHAFFAAASPSIRKVHGEWAFWLQFRRFTFIAELLKRSQEDDTLGTSRWESFSWLLLIRQR
jgi:hypothetical protein